MPATQVLIGTLSDLGNRLFSCGKYLPMHIPTLHGKLTQDSFFIYVACDVNYFNEFGKSIINSVKANTNYGIHIHLFNPTTDQITYCNNQDRVSATFEHVPLDLFDTAASRWNIVPESPDEKLKYDRILTAMGKSDDKTIVERMQRTYYACARFIRLAQLLNERTQVFAIDIDAIVRSNVPTLSADKDFYIHHITGKKARFLAGGLYLTGSGQGYKFLKEYADILKEHIQNDTLHWGIDQDVLDYIVPKYNFGNLPISYIDWEMRPNSCIWTAKGKRKELAIFINEQKKYNS